MSDLKPNAKQRVFRTSAPFMPAGNVLFESRASEAHVETRPGAATERLRRQTRHCAGPHRAEMQAIHKANPFPKSNQSGAVAIFLDEAPRPDELKSISGRTVEQIKLASGEIYVDYCGTLANSKLRIPAARLGTARNLNT